LPYFAAAVSRNQRIALVVAALVVAVAAFVIAQPGDDDEPAETTATTPAQTDDGGTGAPETETETETETEPASPPEPAATRIRIEGGAVVGGQKTIEAERGDTVRIIISTNAPDELHLHGYDIEREAEPGRPARFRFEADAEGEFVLESHTAEHAGNDPVIARLLIGPS
jgi:FtsP/CotA-like multicopper oxidase with cupredoxin domain